MPTTRLAEKTRRPSQGETDRSKAEQPRPKPEELPKKRKGPGRPKKAKPPEQTPPSEKTASKDKPAAKDKPIAKDKPAAGKDKPATKAKPTTTDNPTANDKPTANDNSASQTQPPPTQRALAQKDPVKKSVPIAPMPAERLSDAPNSKIVESFNTAQLQQIKEIVHQSVPQVAQRALPPLTETANIQDVSADRHTEPAPKRRAFARVRPTPAPTLRNHVFSKDWYEQLQIAPINSTFQVPPALENPAFFRVDDANHIALFRPADPQSAEADAMYQVQALLHNSLNDLDLLVQRAHRGYSITSQIEGVWRKVRGISEMVQTRYDILRGIQRGDSDQVKLLNFYTRPAAGDSALAQTVLHEIRDNLRTGGDDVTLNAPQRKRVRPVDTIEKEPSPVQKPGRGRPRKLSKKTAVTADLGGDAVVVEKPSDSARTTELSLDQQSKRTISQVVMPTPDPPRRKVGRPRKNPNVPSKTSAVKTLTKKDNGHGKIRKLKTPAVALAPAKSLKCRSTAFVFVIRNYPEIAERKLLSVWQEFGGFRWTLLVFPKGDNDPLYMSIFLKCGGPLTPPHRTIQNSSGDGTLRPLAPAENWSVTTKFNIRTLHHTSAISKAAVSGKDTSSMIDVAALDAPGGNDISPKSPNGMGSEYTGTTKHTFSNNADNWGFPKLAPFANLKPPLYADKNMNVVALVHLQLDDSPSPAVLTTQ